jgi:hypothetical protein
MRLTHKPSKVRIHFRSATCNIQRLDGGMGQYIQALLHGVASHNFFSIGAGIDMTMFANLIAHVPDIHLKDFNLARLQWKMPKWFNLLFEGGELSRFKNPILKEFYLAFLIGELMVTRVQ